MKLTLDVENTVTKRDGKMYLDPFEPDNRLVMVGCLTDTGKEYLYRDNFDGVQALLDEATILIGHNIAYDLMWLWECGFKYDGPVFDTMLAEYVVQRGQKQPLSLSCLLIYQQTYMQPNSYLMCCILSLSLQMPSLWSVLY